MFGTESSAEGPHMTSPDDPKRPSVPASEPGKRSGTGVDSLIPHLQRQTQTQVKMPVTPKSSPPKKPKA
ncbi:MAG: hypothetical protein JWQ07_2696 [Ramlibacter sp.]|nr:hypothetical protein [Ramlibacter sp.]